MASSFEVYLHDVAWAEYDDPQPLASLPAAHLDQLETTLLSSAIDLGLAAITGRNFPASDAVRRGYYLAFADSQLADVTPRRWMFQQDYYGVTADGRLFIDDVALSRMTLGDLARAGESGYLDGSWNRVVVMRPEGLGGGGQVGDLANQFLEFLNSVGVELAVVAATATPGRVRRRVQSARDDRRAREIVRQWDANGIDNPWELRRWIDKKTAWEAPEVATRLAIRQAEAEALLSALGYEFSERLSQWTVGTTRNAKKRRKLWDQNEF